MALTPESDAAAPPWPLVSIVVAVRNGGDDIAQCVRMLLEQDYPRFEVLVVDDASTDGTREFLLSCQQGDPRVRAILLPAKANQTYARNLAIQSARGRYVAIVDHDCFAPPDWLSRFYDDLMRSGCEVGIGYSRSTGRNAYARCIGRQYEEWLMNRVVTRAGRALFLGFDNRNALVKKSVFLRHGDFDVAATPSADRDFGMRLHAQGVPIAFCRRALLTHQDPVHFRDQFDKCARRIRSWKYLNRKHHARLNTYGLESVLFGLGAVSVALAPFSRPTLAAAGALLILLSFSRMLRAFFKCLTGRVPILSVYLELFRCAGYIYGNYRYRFSPLKPSAVTGRPLPTLP